MLHKYFMKPQEHENNNVTSDRISPHYGKARSYEEILILFPCWFLTSLATYVLLVGRNINLGHFITLGGVLWLSLVLMYCHWAWLPGRSALHNELKSILKKHSDLHPPEFLPEIYDFGVHSLKMIGIWKKPNENTTPSKEFQTIALWHDKLENSPNSKSIFNIGSIEKCAKVRSF